MDIKTLEERLSRPTPGLITDFQMLNGDVLILGVGGKMGPTLATMARRALPGRHKVIGASLFSSQEMRQSLEDAGIETLQGDLLDEAFLRALPEVPNIIYMAGFKFGSAENPAYTWAINTLLPAMVARRFPTSRIAAFSTGNVYPFVPASSGGCVETHPVGPVGEYAQSCLGRERMLQYFSLVNKTPMVIIRLNYAVEMRYGVLVDIAQKVRNSEPIDLTVGHCNFIWQGDANAMALRALKLAASPAEILNLTGGEVYSIRQLATEFGKLFQIEPIFVSSESGSALLNNARRALDLLGPLTVSVEEIIRWTAEWILEEQPMLNKPTHFETSDGTY